MPRVLFYHQFLIVILLLFFSSQAGAKSVQLTWDASSSAVSGYKIYYQANSATLPLSGTGAAEGASPINAGNRVSITVTGLADDEEHYFTVSAYDAAGNESDYSNLVHSRAKAVLPPPVVIDPIPETEPEDPFQPVSSPDWDRADQIGAGFLDSGFGEGGILSQIARQAVAGGPQISVRPDGKFILLGETYLSRYLPDGSLDRSFGQSGVVDNLNAAGQVVYWSAYDLILQQDGKILVTAATFNEESIVLRYFPDGRLDRTFAQNGILDGLPSGLRCFSSRVQADGRILLAGDFDSGFAIVRLTAAGGLDGSFGNNGIAVIDLSPDIDTALDLAPQSDGKIVVVGRSRLETETAWSNERFGKMALLRLLADGRVDTSFGSRRNGIVELNLPDQDASALRVLISSEQILLAGYAAHGTWDEGILINLSEARQYLSALRIKQE